jgi:uncharacterized protein
MRSVILLCAVMTASVAFAEPAAFVANETRLEVEAEGEVTRPADKATLTASATTNGSTSQQAVAANALLSDRIVVALTSSGLVASLRSPSYSVDSTSTDEDSDITRKPRILGYTASKTFEIEVKDVKRVGEIIDILAAKGATEISQPQFDLKDRDGALKAARFEAVRRAKLEAENYAEAAGLKVSRTLRLSERSKYSDNGVEEIVVTAQRANAPPPPATKIEPGEITVSVTLYADYGLTPR